MNKIYKLISVFLLILLISISWPIAVKPASALGGEWFVSENGTGTACSQANPGPLKYCVETKAQSGDTVYVEEGFYQSQNNPLADNLLLMQKSLHLVGSCTWDSTGPVMCYPQNKAPFTSTSYLDGNNQQRVIAIQGSGLNVSIEGFQIQYGNAENKQPEPGGAILGAGGGVYAGGLDSLVLKNNYFWQNNATVSGTSALNYGYGGGVFAYGIANLDIRENTFIFNSASTRESSGLGGGMYVIMCGDSGRVNIRSNTFHENMVGNDFTYSRGAGAFLSLIGNLDLSDNIFEYHNHTQRHDYIKGSALVLDIIVGENSIDHNMFRLNFGVSIVDVEGLTGAFTRNTFWENTCSYGLIIKDENNIEISNNFFGKTEVGSFSIDISIGEESETPVVDIINNTFAQTLCGVRVDAYADVHILRNIFTKQTLRAIDTHSANTYVYVNENLFWDNDDNGTTGTTYWEEDPKFVDLSTGNLHLQCDSGAIDKVSGGTITTDIDGQPRPIGLGIDLGADEYGITIHLPLIIR
jgi:hypothetical protein